MIVPYVSHSIEFLAFNIRKDTETILNRRGAEEQRSREMKWEKIQQSDTILKMPCAHYMR